MTRTTSLIHRLGLLGTMAAVVLAPTLAASTLVASTTAAQAESTPSDATPAVEPAAPDIALNVATELARLGGTGTRLDTSADAVKCVFGADPAPLTYSTREIVIRDEDITNVADALGAVDTAIGAGPGDATSAEKLLLPTVPGPVERMDGEPLTPLFVVHVVPEEGEADVVLVARRLRGTGTTASPNYLMAPQKDGPVGILPNGYPENTDIVTPKRTVAPSLGDGTNAFVVDVGIPPAKWSNRPENVEELEPGLDKEVLDILAPEGKVDCYWAGHSTAISSELETLVPGAEVQAVKVTSGRRIITDVSATIEISDALQNAADAPEVVIASFGSAACDSAFGEMVPLGLEAIAEAVDRRGESVIVAAAGNNATSRKFYPAAFDTDPNPDPDNDVVIGVGALDAISATDPVDAETTGMWISETRSGPPADFSNFGPWVDAWAPGHGLPVRHIKELRFLKRLDEMTGQAIVDGTSYAAPYAGSLILEQLSLHGGTPLAAWQDIRDAGADCERGLGGKAIALSAMDDFADTPAVGASQCVITP